MNLLLQLSVGKQCYSSLRIEIVGKAVGKQEASEKHTIGMLLGAIESIIKGVGKSVDAQDVGKALIFI